MTIYNISLLQEKVLFDTLFLSKKPSHIPDNIVPEIEIRIGRILQDKSQLSKHFFSSGLYENIWTSILNRIKNTSVKNNQAKYYSSKDIVYSTGNFRKIVNSNGSEIYQQKIKSSGDKDNIIDINIITKFNMKLNQYQKPEFTGLRVAKSYEIPINKNIYDKNKGNEVQFIRERYSIEYDTFTLDFTKRTQIDNDKFNYRSTPGKKHTFELEIELNPSFIKSLIITDEKGTTTFKVAMFFDMLKKSLSLIYPNLHSLFFESYYNTIIEPINKILALSPREIKPVNIQDIHLKEGFNNFSITNKLDGVGYNLLFTNEIRANKEYVNILLQNKKDIWKLDMVLKSTIESKLSGIDISPLRPSLMDRLTNSNVKTEVRILPDQSIEINIYDCLLYKDKIENLSLIERYEICKEILNTCNSLNIKNVNFKLKEYFYDKNFRKNISDVVSYMYKNFSSNIIKENDGIIFQYNGSYSTYPAYKWKFPSLITVDFTAKYLGEDATTITYQLLSVYKDFKLERFSLSQLEDSNENPYDSKYIITLNKKDNIDGYRTIELDNYVLECNFDINQNKWNIHRIRFDKGPTDSNYITVALSTFNDMILNTTLPELVNKVENIRINGPSVGFPSDISSGIKTQSIGEEEKCLVGFRKVSNLIKESIIKSYSDNKKIILDIGSGKGGDLPKYQKYGIKKLYAVEPSLTNIEEFNNRLNQTYTKLLDKIVLINSKGEEKDKIQSYIKDQIDRIFMFYSMSFFFKDKSTLDNLIELVSKNLIKNEDIFSGTMMEGTLIENKLLKNNISTTCYDIKNINIVKDNIFGQEIEIDYKGTETATLQREYLAYYQELEHLLIYHDFIGHFQLSIDFYSGTEATRKKYTLDQDEKDLLSNYIDFTFIKNKNIYKQSCKVDIFQPYPVHQIFDSKKDYWYRTKSDSDGSCLFHSVLMLLLGNEYKKEYTRDLREKIANDFQLNDYINLQEGQNAIIDFQTIVVDTINIECFDICPFVSDKQIKDFISDKMQDFFTGSPATESKNKQDNVFDIINYLVKEMKNKGFNEEETQLILNAYVYHNFDILLNNIRDCNVWAEYWMIIYLQKYLKINIIIIDSNTYKYLPLGLTYNSDLISIVILNINNTHFEPLVRRNKIFGLDSVNDTSSKNNIDSYQRTFKLEELKNILI